MPPPEGAVFEAIVPDPFAESFVVFVSVFLRVAVFGKLILRAERGIKIY
jgi:hypothetical protein